MRYVVVEGLPALGKSETLELLARFYPDRIIVLPELVKDVALNEGIDIFAQRQRLTEALISAIPRRQAEIEDVIGSGKLCLEESHLGVHLAYARALGDNSFVKAYKKIERSLLRPDLYLRFAAPISVSVARQQGRNTSRFFVPGEILERMMRYLNEWHLSRRTKIVSLNADRPVAVFLKDVEEALGLHYVSGNTQIDEVLPVIFLLGRPASGKSEFIDFMSKTPLPERTARYHIGELRVIDDFPMLWEKFIEDDIWVRLGRNRLYSRPADGNYMVTDPGIWPFLTEKLNSQANKELENLAPGETLLIEFSRGDAHGYRESLIRFSPAVLSRAAILYLDVSFAESIRRNRARYEEAYRDSILTHSVPREEMETTYRTDDWKKTAPAPYGKIKLSDIEIPYVTMKNEPELTDPQHLDARYHSALDRLWDEFTFL